MGRFGNAHNSPTSCYWWLIVGIMPASMLSLIRSRLQKSWGSTTSEIKQLLFNWNLSVSVVCFFVHLLWGHSLRLHSVHVYAQQRPKTFQQSHSEWRGRFPCTAGLQCCRLDSYLYCSTRKGTWLLFPAKPSQLSTSKIYEIKYLLLLIIQCLGWIC